MGLYEGIKDVARIVQQADNIELYKTLLDLGAQALDMQEEIFLLQKQNEDLKTELNRKQSIIRHKGLFTIVKDEFQNRLPHWKGGILTDFQLTGCGSSAPRIAGCTAGSTGLFGAAAPDGCPAL